MRIVVLHSDLCEGAGKDEEDVLVQVREVSEALSTLGHDAVSVPFSLNIRSTVDVLDSIRPALVFNLVETVEGSGRLIHVAPAVLDHMKIPYTGAPTEAVFLSSNKLISKTILQSSGISTPQWITRDMAENKKAIQKHAYIIKSVWEHASIGLGEDSIIAAEDANCLLSEMEARRDKLGGDCFAEVYIDGREFNLSVLGGSEGPVVLPPAEIRFNCFPPEKAKVVGFQAKWAPDSFEYRNTSRTFNFLDGEASILKNLRNIALECWSLFELRGYARVDFRLDTEGKPWVLEVNTNPCLSHDAGFAAAAEEAGLDFKQVVEKIIEDSISTYSLINL